MVIAMAKLPYFTRRSRKKSARSLRTSLLIAFAVAKSMVKNIIIERSRISAIAVILSAE
jgi:ABC-type anion transport system duplicated permease subunit